MFQTQFSMQCGHCQHVLVFATQQHGQSGPCAYCGHMIVAVSGASVQTVSQGGRLVGRMIGGPVAVLGLVFSIFAWTMTRDAGFTFKLFVVGPGMMAMGLALLVFPGARVGPNASSDTWWREAPVLHKAVWMGALTIGTLVGMIAF